VIRIYEELISIGRIEKKKGGYELDAGGDKKLYRHRIPCKMVLS